MTEATCNFCGASDKFRCKNAAQAKACCAFSGRDLLPPRNTEAPLVPFVQEIEVREDAPRVIGLCGPAGSGKSTVAAILAEQGYIRLRFVGPLKTMLRALLAELGVAQGEVERMLEGDLKEDPHPMLCGQTPRHAMQTLGTAWGRECMGGEFWVRALGGVIYRHLSEGARVVVEDVRFANEADAVKWSAAYGHGSAEIWQMAGRGEIAGDHVSETPIPAALVDRVLDNAGGLDALEAMVLEEVLG